MVARDFAAERTLITYHVVSEIMALFSPDDSVRSSEVAGRGRPTQFGMKGRSGEQKQPVGK